MTTVDVALLVARLIVGLGFAAHGAQKLFGWFGGYGLKGTAGFFESIGWRPGTLFVLLAGGGEFFGGLLTALGLLGPIGPALIVAVMIVAISQHVKAGYFAQNGGYELPLAYIASALVLAAVGFGTVALDAALGLVWSTNVILIVLAVAIAGALLSYVARRAPANQANVSA